MYADSGRQSLHGSHFKESSSFAGAGQAQVKLVAKTAARPGVNHQTYSARPTSSSYVSHSTQQARLPINEDRISKPAPNYLCLYFFYFCLSFLFDSLPCCSLPTSRFPFLKACPFVKGQQLSATHRCRSPKRPSFVKDRLTALHPISMCFV